MRRSHRASPPCRCAPARWWSRVQVLLQLEAPDLAYRARASAVRVKRAQGELARIPASDRQRESALVLQ